MPPVVAISVIVNQKCRVTSIYITLLDWDVGTIDDSPINVETMPQITLDLPLRAIASWKYNSHI